MMEKTNPSWLDRGLIYKLRVALFLILTAVYFYAVDGKLNVAVKYAVNCAIFAWAFMEFLLVPDTAKAKELARMGLIFLTPFYLMWCYSLAIWIYELRSVDYIIRGSENIIYMTTNMLMMLGSYYLFEEKCVPLTLLMAVAANLFCAFMVGRQYGFGPLLHQYYRQIVTFSGEGGAAIQKMEFHDMCYGFGAYCVYYVLHRKNGRVQWPYLLLAFASFFFAMKRIGVIAVAAGCAVGFVYMLLNDKWRKRTLIAMCLAFALGGFLFVWSIKSKVFLTLVDRFGINTSGRTMIYYEFDDKYSVSPMYFGKGIRYIYRYASLTHGWTTIHCVYLELFIELGFWMFFVWALYELYFRQTLLARRAGWEGICILLAETCYVFVTYFTDNTSFQPPVNTFYRMAGMVALFEAMAKRGQLPWKRCLTLPPRQRRVPWRKRNDKAKGA